MQCTFVSVFVLSIEAQMDGRWRTSTHTGSICPAPAVSAAKMNVESSLQHHKTRNHDKTEVLQQINYDRAYKTGKHPATYISKQRFLRTQYMKQCGEHMKEGYKYTYAVLGDFGWSRLG